ncbi:MAG: hypothetical protein HKP30_10190 [Myxococcales bacterium]|nr:hypothetical protein [Myxococcales bacterium]
MKTPIHRRRSVARVAFSLAVACLLSACSGARYSRETFHESRETEVILRARTDVNPRYEHPATISAIRMAHILASLDVRFDENEKKNARTPAIPVEAVYPLGELVSRALAAADERQEVVVMAKFRERRLKLFTSETLTAFSVSLKNDQLYFQISRVGFAVPKNPNERIQEPKPGKEFQAFKVLPSSGVLPVGRQLVAVDWRRDSFRRPEAIRVGAGGRVKRRTILMEEPEAQAPRAAPEDTVDLSDLTPEALRALADLEEQRRAGSIGEAEYLSKKRKILAEGTR